ncbi:MAG: acyl-CoA dehydrogenase family protein, partial [Gammaproteobacteria bacterium]
MDTFFWLLLFIATLWSLFYFRVYLLPATIVMAIYILFWQEFGGSPPFVQGIAWVVFLAIAIPLNVKNWRRQFISDRVLAIFRKILPSMSQTEREALDAGSVWWDGELFSGKPRWSTLLNTTVSHLNEEEKAFIDGPVEELCRMLDDWQITHKDYDLPEAVWQFLKDKGFFAMIIPKHYGGLEFSALAHSTVVMKVAGRSITAAVTIMVPNSLGPAELLLRYGTEQQKDHYLQRLARGIEIPCFALTSPQAGSDAAAMTDSGVV